MSKYLTLISIAALFVACGGESTPEPETPEGAATPETPASPETPAAEEAPPAEAPAEGGEAAPAEGGGEAK